MYQCLPLQYICYSSNPQSSQMSPEVEQKMARWLAVKYIKHLRHTHSETADLPVVVVYTPVLVAGIYASVLRHTCLSRPGQHKCLQQSERDESQGACRGILSLLVHCSICAPPPRYLHDAERQESPKRPYWRPWEQDCSIWCETQQVSDGCQNLKSSDS